MSRETAIERSYVKLSRPTGPYVMYLILLFAFVVVPSVLLAVGKEAHPMVLPEDFYYLAGTFFGIYAAGRSWEKVKGALGTMLANAQEPPQPSQPQNK